MKMASPKHQISETLQIVSLRQYYKQVIIKIAPPKQVTELKDKLSEPEKSLKKAITSITLATKKLCYNFQNRLSIQTILPQVSK